jgi:peptide/nickel transport system ATP-binding protein/oligopeptide transport system ATP-binding protein
MYLGEVVELAPKEELFAHPRHPYTKALLSAVPIPDPSRRNMERQLIKGEVTSPIDPKPGCRFAARCEHCDKCGGRCTESNPEFVEVSPGHYVSCFLVNDK